MKFMNCALKSLAMMAAMRSASGFASPAALLRRQGVVKQAASYYYSNTRSSSSNSLSATSKMDQSFPTWSFDNPCLAMEWNELIPATLTATTELPAESDLVIVGIYGPAESDDDDNDAAAPVVVLEGAVKEMDETLGGMLSEVINDNAKTFKAGAKAGAMTPTIRVASSSSAGKSKRYVVVGLGSKPADDDDKNKSNGFSLGKAIAEKLNDETKVGTCSVVVPDALLTTAAFDISSSLYAALYSDNRFRTGDKIEKLAEDLTSIQLVGTDMTDDVAAALEAGRQMANGIFTTKDIVNAPHNVLNSLSLAATAQRIADESNGTIQCTILGKEDCEERGMGAYLGVARGSETPPQFIHLTYTPPNNSKDNKKVGIVGKGLLFDTGGYNIKTQMMELMKFDCGGSAAVLGAARAIGALAPEGVEAHFIVAACENMINEKAYVASDILTASNGKTIEIVNTDAEGRLTLADAIVYADKEVGCDSIIELSTLTGACMISLGKEVCGVWTKDDDLAKELEEISKDTGDKSWRMPLEMSYNEQLESKIADLTNCGTSYGGAITAALFLENFVDKKKPFAHIDIAGPVWSDKTGATGFGARMVTEWVTRQGQSKAE
eukprot:CAMPEP_0119027254 /NCGR_PEP_ID=MMETSP1176-20130426/36791_1 /TAXON_ID=265551 /ORGANISM="Synedropsis recta cf, Strain CCMP1620" /LENGTH=607 /DNA_ID=CAMNT_0006983133 /DNA_START=21 /DNA_END=1844 /DNA_ORIENTATION=-